MLSFDSAERIVIECVGEEAVRAIRQSMLLPSARPAFDPPAPRLLIMLFTSRTGSTHAGRLLAQTPYFNKVRGAFHPPHLARVRERQGFADDAAAARALVARDATPLAFGAKCGPAGLVGALYTGFLHSALDRVSFVTIRRRDAVAQAVSLVRAALTGRYFSSQPVGIEIGIEDYDREAIAEQIALVERLNAGIDLFVERLGKQSPTYFYEDICGDPAAFVRSICDRLGLPPIEAIPSETGLAILRDDVSRQWREQYRAGL